MAINYTSEKTFLQSAVKEIVDIYTATADKRYLKIKQDVVEAGIEIPDDKSLQAQFWYLKGRRDACGALRQGIFRGVY